MKHGYKKIYEYVRDKQGRPIGCLYAFKDDTSVDPRVWFGWSKYAVNKESVRFSKSEAVESAIIRTIDLHSRSTLPFALRKPMDKFVDRCHRYFKESIWNYEE